MSKYLYVVNVDLDSIKEETLEAGYSTHYNQYCIVAQTYPKCVLCKCIILYIVCLCPCVTMLFCILSAYACLHHPTLPKFWYRSSGGYFEDNEGANTDILDASLTFQGGTQDMHDSTSLSLLGSHISSAEDRAINTTILQ